MATLLHLPSEEFFSDRYMEAFYKAHVASRTRSNLDEDIAAIEAEIKKVKKFRSKFRRCKYEHQLNSCGSSECSDEDDFDTPLESVTTSVFKVSNTTPDSYRPTSYPPMTCVYGSKDNMFAFPRGPDIFTWAVTQQISHDHGYCKPGSVESHTFIERGTINMKNIQWHLLPPLKQALAVHKLSCILQHRPSGRHSPTFSSFDLLPTSLANIIKKTGSLGLMLPSRSDSGGSKSVQLTKTPTIELTSTHKETAPHKDIGIKEIKGRERTQQKLSTPRAQSSKGNVGPIRSSLRKRTRPSPYTHQHSKMEVTRMRSVSSCSEGGEDPVIID